MIIQKCLCPFNRLQEWQKELYVRGNRYSYTDNGYFNLLPTGFIQTDTFFNAFSVKKWRTYTDLDTLFLSVRAKGQYRIIVKQTYAVKLDITDRVIVNSVFDGDTHIDLSDALDLDGLISYHIQAMTALEITSVVYETKTIPTRCPSIAIGVCTFKREPYIKRMVEDFSKIDSSHVSLFISDNASSLEIPSFDKVHLVNNKNYGGAGGFARCILEVIKHNKGYEKITHILLMDDDILIDQRIFERLLALLSYVTRRYRSYFVSGSMFNLDNPNIQTEMHAAFNGTNEFRAFGQGNMFDFKEIVLNEVINDHRQEQCTSGWWFTCIPMDVINERNYPFPCFFRGDDLEYAFRNKSKAITINGLGVWHEPFYKKYTNTSEDYYLPRNLLVINTLYRANGLNESLIYLDKRFRECVTQYNYNGAQLVLMALEHYMQGVEFFKNTDPEKLNKELSAYNYKLSKIEDVFGEFAFRDMNWEAELKNDDNQKKKIRKWTADGYRVPLFLFKEFGFSYYGFAGKSINYYKVKRVFNLDPFSKMGYFTEIDKKRYKQLKTQYMLLRKRLISSYPLLKDQYSLRFSEITNKKFWIEYLGLHNEDY